MTRKLLTIALFALTLSTMFLAACQASAKPEALTGIPNAARYTDDKGHYHADLAAQNAPLR